MHPLHVLADGFESFGVMSNDVMAGGLATRSWTGATPLVLAASLAVLMALVSLVRGVRAFSFGLTWWGKHGQLRLRVESFATLAEGGATSAAGTCLVTAGGISGIFCAELVEGEAAGDGDGMGMLDGHGDGDLGAGKEDGNLQLSLVKKSRVMGTEMGFFFYQQRQSSLSLSSLAPAPKCDADCCCTASSKLAFECDWSPLLSGLPSSLCQREDEFGDWEDVVVEEAVEEDSGARRPEIGSCELSALLRQQEIDSKLCTFTMPDWACSLLEPLQIGALSRKSALPPRNRKSVKLKTTVDSSDFPLWRLQLTAEVFSSQGHGRRPQIAALLPGKPRSSPSHVVKGEKLMATSRDGTVRIWECRHPVETLYLPRGDSVSSIDVNWDAGTASVGTAAGLLSLWDLERALLAGSTGAHAGQVEALQMLPGSGLSVTGGAAGPGEAISAVGLWDARMLAQGMAAGSVVVTGRNSIINGLKAQGHQIFVRDALGCISGLDLRKLVSTPLETMNAELANCARLKKLSPSDSGNKESRGEDSLCCPTTGESVKEGKFARSEEVSRWWDKEVGYRSEEDDEEDGWPNGILCSYPEGSSAKPSWIGRLIGEIKSQLHL